MRAPIVYATLIVVTAVVPVLFMQGLTGSFFKPLIHAICSRLRLTRRGDDGNAGACLILLRGARLEGRESR